MSRVSLVTWKDLIDHTVDWMGVNPEAEAIRSARRATLNAMRDLANEANWIYYYGRCRITTSAPYTTGTIEYDHTGGAYERVVTLSGGTWPSWASLGTLVINNTPYEVSARKSATEITLTSGSNPGEDVAAGSTYTLFRDTYTLPNLFKSVGTIVMLGYSTLLAYEHISSWMNRQRIFRSPAMPMTYCLRGDPDYQNSLAISLYPPPDAVYDLDMTYQRRPRDLKIDDYSEGTLTTTSGAATVSGSGTNWTSRLLGSVIRISGNTTDYPTGPAGGNPAAYERVIVSVGGTGSLTLDDTVDETLTNVKYLISDPVDIETGSMLTALYRGCEYQIATIRRMDNVEKYDDAYRRALIRAREADARSFREEVAGGRRPWPVRMSDMPMSGDQ